MSPLRGSCSLVVRQPSPHALGYVISPLRGSRQSISSQPHKMPPSPSMPHEIVFWNARALAAMSTVLMASNASTFGQRSVNVAPRMMIAREILMK
jgi:hypothetical protein